MLKTDKFADIHVHLGGPDMDNDLAMLKELSEYGIKNINIAVLTYLGYAVDNNMRALYFKEKFKDAKISVFGGLYYSPYINHYEIPFLEQAEKLLALGCDGIKLIKNKPNYRKYIGFGMNSKIYNDMFDMLEEKQIPLLCHVNDPEEFWDKESVMKWACGPHIISRGWLYDSEDYLKYNEILDEVIARLDRNPKLNIVFAHFMFMSGNIKFVEELFNKYPNVKFDLTPGWEMYIGFRENYDEWKEFFEKYSDRIIYGSDSHGFPINKKSHETVRCALDDNTGIFPIPFAPEEEMRGFDLSKSAQEKICYNNFISLIGEPKLVNVELLKEETNDILNRVRRNNGDAECIKRLEKIASEL